MFMKHITNCLVYVTHIYPTSSETFYILIAICMKTRYLEFQLPDQKLSNRNQPKYFISFEQCDKSLNATFNLEMLHITSDCKDVIQLY